MRLPGTAVEMFPGVRVLLIAGGLPRGARGDGNAAASACSRVDE